MKKAIMWILCMILLITFISADEGLQDVTGKFAQITGKFADVTGRFASEGTFILNNQAPILESLDDIIGAEGDLITITPNATDPNGDSVTYSFSVPFNSSGQWQTGEDDGGIYTIKVYASDGGLNSTTTLTVSISPYCGDGICNYNGVESCATCHQDCGQCPATSTPSDGGGGGGASYDLVDELEVEIAELRGHIDNANKSVADFTSTAKEMYFLLEQEEFLGHKIDVTNHLKNKSINLKFKIVGELSSSIVLDMDEMSIGAGEIGELNFLVLANREPGLYESNLMIISAENFQSIPIALRVTDDIESISKLETLDIDLDILTKDVYPGKKMKYMLKLRKTPLITEEMEDVNLKALILSLNEDTANMISGASVSDLFIKLKDNMRNLLFTEEDIELMNTDSIIREINIPLDFVTGEYLITVNAKYRENTIPISAKFNVIQPWYHNKYAGMDIRSLLAMISLIVLLSGFFIVSRLKQGVSKRYQRDVLAVDRRTLGKKSKSSAYLGKLVEGDREAFLDLENLKTHALIAGSTGSGKTIAAQVVAEEAIKKKIPVIVIDPTGQWTGFMKRCKDRKMVDCYNEYSIDPKDAKGFEGTIKDVKNPLEFIDIKRYINDKGIHIFRLSHLHQKQIDLFISNFVGSVFSQGVKESSKLKLLVFMDEVHRLLPKFGGSGQGFVQLERGVREFRKWGIGLVLVSQLMDDFMGAIEANISTNLLFRTSDKSDLEKIEARYSSDFAKYVHRSKRGAGLLANPEYNHGVPFFIKFRPIMHHVKGLSQKTIDKYVKYDDIIDDLKYKLQKIDKKKTFDLQIELGLAEDQVRTGKFDVAEIYLKSLIPKMKKKLQSVKNKKKKLVSKSTLMRDYRKVLNERNKIKNKNKKLIEKMNSEYKRIVKVKRSSKTMKKRFIKAMNKYEKAKKTRDKKDISTALKAFKVIKSGK